MKWSRRAFIKGSALAAFASTLGGVPAFVLKAAAEQSKRNPGIGAKRKILVCIFQRGAMDGLQAVQPIDDPFLRKVRPDLLVPATGDNRLIELDGRFGLNPLFHPFAPLFQEGRMAVVHGIGSPIPNRSHFDAQDYMENGTPGRKSTPSGWLNRAVGLLGHEGTPFQAVSMTPATPKSLYGDAYALTIENLDDLKIAEGNASSVTNQGFEVLYRQTTQEIIQNTGTVSLDAVKILEEARVKSITPSAGAAYPRTPLGQALQQIAQLIKGGVGLEVAFAESNGWDTHSRQSTPFGGFTRNARDLSGSIAAFWKDIERYQDEVVVMTMTEFGRTVEQNGSFGTDHGRGSCMFVLGNAVDGGGIYGEVPELAFENLEDRRDLPVTTDFRSLFAGVVTNHLHVPHSPDLFPGWDGDMLNVFKSDHQGRG